MLEGGGGLVVGGEGGDKGMEVIKGKARGSGKEEGGRKDGI